MDKSIKRKLYLICDDIKYFYNYYSDIKSEFIKRYSNIESLKIPLEKSNLNLNLEDIFVIPEYSFDGIEIDESLNDKASPLDVTLKSQYERAFNADFSNVKIHTGELADKITRESNADAVTIGEDIYFAGEKWTPGTEESEALSAHELQHIKQNQEDRRFVYLEDIWEVEKEAGIVENKIKNVRLHNVEAPVLDVSDTDIKDEQIQVPKEEKEIEAQSEISGNSDKLLFEIYFSNSNKKYLVTAEEKQKAIEYAIQKLKQDIEEEMRCLTEDNRDKYMLKLMNCIL
jgi:hypothetical protein